MATAAESKKNRKRSSDAADLPSKAAAVGQETATGQRTGGDDGMGEFEDAYEDELEEEVVDADAMEEDDDMEGE